MLQFSHEALHDECDTSSVILSALKLVLQAIFATVQGIVHPDWHLLSCQLPLLFQAILEPHC